jgi:hypothetical protein
MLAGRSTALLRTRRLVESTVRSFMVVQTRENPTTDYYLAPRLPPELTRYVRLAAAGQGIAARPGELVIFCRYVNAGWLDWLERNRGALAGAVLFLDDDVDLVLRSRSTPPAYRLRVWNRHHRYLRRIAASIDELWVSTEVLSARYGGECLTLPPVPPPLPSKARDNASSPVIAYHATAVHRTELAWLGPVLAGVMRRAPQARLHVVGFSERNRVTRNLPRTWVRSQISWPDYRVLAPALEASIGLAPLLPSALNEARSCTKAFDIARLGAAGVYSDEAPYRSLVTDGISGVLLPPNRRAWESAITELLYDEPRRSAIVGAMARKLTERRTALLRDRTLLHRVMAQREGTLEAREANLQRSSEPALASGGSTTV